MSREIKFRAWHKNRKKYYKVMHLHVETPLNGGVWATCKGFNIIKQDDVKIQVQPGDCIIEQFTGLKDKNGVEIYEGDIVKTIHHIDGNFISMGIVKYCIIFEKFSFQMKPVEPAVYTVSMVLGEDTSIEIIGNIHQNPELLKR